MPHGRRARCTTSRQFRNCDNICLGTHDARCAVACHYRLGNHHHDASLATTRTMAPDANQVLPSVCWQRRTITSTIKIRFQKSCTQKRDVGPTYRFAASPKVGLGSLSVPCRPGTPVYNLQVKTRDRTCTHALLCVPQLWTKPPCLDRL
jgi:hypothetical protein